MSDQFCVGGLYIMKNDFFKVLFDVPDIWKFQETEDVSQVVKMDNDREHKVFKVKYLSKRVLFVFFQHPERPIQQYKMIHGYKTFVVLSNFQFKPNIFIVIQYSQKPREFVCQPLTC